MTHFLTWNYLFIVSSVLASVSDTKIHPSCRHVYPSRFAIDAFLKILDQTKWSSCSISNIIHPHTSFMNSACMPFSKKKTKTTSQSDTSMPMNLFGSIDRNQKDKIVTSHSFSNNSKLSNDDSRDPEHKKTEMFIFSNACQHCTTKQTSFSFECGFLQERKLSYWCRPSTPWPLRRKSWLPCARNMQIW